MKPMSGFVLVVAALLTSPALTSAAVGEMALEIALTRYLMAVGVCWVLLTIASEWFWSEPASSARVAPESEEPAEPVDS